MYTSPGKIMVGNYVPQTASQNFLLKNSGDPTNLRYAAVRPKHSESAFKNLVYSPPGRTSSKPKSKKVKTSGSYAFGSSGSKGEFSKLSRNPNFVLTGDKLMNYTGSFKSSLYSKKSDSSRGGSFNKRPSSGTSLGSHGHRSASGSLKRKKPRDSPKQSHHLYNYTGTSATSKFLAGKSLSKYASVDHLMGSKKSLKPSIKVKSAKLSNKQSKNSSMDSLFSKNRLLDSDLKYSYKGIPSNLKVKKERSKLKKKKSKPEMGYLHKQASKSQPPVNGSEPLSINIVNTNHLHLSGYNNQGKAQSNQNSSMEKDKKENYQNIIKNFNPTQKKANPKEENSHREDKKVKKLMQEIKTTKPKKSKGAAEGEFLVHFDCFYLTGIKYDTLRFL
jgi:hypothetical protein